MVTGVRSDIAVKVFGDDLDQLKKVAGQIGKVAQSLQGAQDLRIERISGQQYLSIEIDLTERVLVRPREGTAGGLNVIHVPEPPHPGNIEQHEHWTLWLKDELLAEWDHDPR